MTKTLNTKKLATEIEKLPYTKIDVAKKCGISRVTLDSVLKGKEIGLHKFLKIIDILKIDVGYFFDEELKTENRSAGRDYVEKGKIEHHGTEYNTSNPVPNAYSDYRDKRINELEQENSELKKEIYETKQKLIVSQEKIIELMEKG